MTGGKLEGAAEKRRYGLPPLVHLRAIMDVKGYTRADLANRSGLSQPTVSRVIEGRERVRPSTAEKVARAVGVPMAALHDEMAFAELRGQLKLPPVVAGRGYGYPESPEGEGGENALMGGFETRESGGTPVGGHASEGSAGNGEARQYVILHREEWRAMHETLARISGRLAAIEEAVGELATRPIAQFEVDIDLKEKGRG